jgi:two-component system cell cycle response regulator
MAGSAGGEDLVRQLQTEIARLNDENQKLKVSNRRWMRIAGTDDLTGLPNKVFFSTALLPQQISQSTAESQPLACIMLAPDGLGQINQKYGRVGGDQVIKGMAEFLKENLEDDEKLVHLDGTNFIVVIPNADLGRARRRSLTLRARVVSRRFECCGDGIALTLSMGIVCRTGSAENGQVNTKQVVDEFLVRLAAALDLAKKQGGDRPAEDPETNF